jgi:hypothetical protein
MPAEQIGSSSATRILFGPFELNVAVRKADEVMHTQLAVAFGLFDGLRGVCESKTRLFLALRPPKLSRRSTEHMTEMTR